jgi:hypothetical protein
MKRLLYGRCQFKIDAAKKNTKAKKTNEHGPDRLLT